MHNEFSVAFADLANRILLDHLVRADREEDLCFGFWNPSRGAKRFTALVEEICLPQGGDRQRHGNASFNTQYFERICEQALKTDRGIAFFHSHPGPGWQSMSQDDVAAEIQMAGAAFGLTDLPLLGLTVGSDGTWSARFWLKGGERRFDREWCRSVRSVGEQLNVAFAEHLVGPPEYNDMFRRTISVWGVENHAKLVRLRIGIVGLGSVGSLVAEILARSGFERITLIDFDEIQLHNLDRLVGATKGDIGRLKVYHCREHLQEISTAKRLGIDAVPYSVAEEQGYLAALDCDVLFSCVDRPRARQILNHFAYAHLIPVIDGGIAVRFKNKKFRGVDWQLQTAGPGRPCLECLRTFSPSDASTEIAGMLDDPSYLQGLGEDHHFKRNENIFAFSANLASLEFLQLIALVTGLGGIVDFGVQRFRYVPGIIDQIDAECRGDCFSRELTATGDRQFTLMGRDLGAEVARARQAGEQLPADGPKGRFGRWWNRLTRTLRGL